VVITKDLQTGKMFINGSFVQQGRISSSQNVQDTKITTGASSNFSRENGSNPFPNLQMMWDRVCKSSKIRPAGACGMLAETILKLITTNNHSLQ
jgi:hypothetical protein